KRKKDDDRQGGDDGAKDAMAVADRARSAQAREGDGADRPAAAQAQSLSAVAGQADETAGSDDKATAAAAAASIVILAPAPPEEEPEKPWWQNVDEKGKPLNVTLADLDKDADGTVAKRMVKGFLVAVDKTFSWNNRSWYKTTASLVAPADRMYIVKP